MKRLAIIFLSIFMSCSSDDPNSVENLNQLNIAIEQDSRNPKVDVCHFDSGQGKHKILNISINALEAHLAHGDVQLIDMDNDGFYESETDCASGFDCDDNDPNINVAVEEICGNGVDDNCNGLVDEDCFPSFIHEGKVYFTQFSDAKAPYGPCLGCAPNICESLVLGGYDDWKLPSITELESMYSYRDSIGGFNTYPFEYWSSTFSYWSGANGDKLNMKTLYFNSGIRSDAYYVNSLPYRCVRCAE